LTNIIGCSAFILGQTAITGETVASSIYFYNIQIGVHLPYGDLKLICEELN